MSEFASLRITGGLVSSALLDRVFAGDPQVPGTGPDTYGLERGESVRQQASRSWLYLVDVWQDFQRRLAEGNTAGAQAAAEARSARVTRERWLRILLRELGFHNLSADGTVDLDGKTFPVSHRSGNVPVHLLGWGTELDHRTPNVTARAPQSMLQELLNRDDERLWALLSNGVTLRLLRDSAALVGSAYVEFDLQAIFDGELFSDFVLLYLACHETRFAPEGDGGPETCYLEQWRNVATEQGERALEQLRKGVEDAIALLGTGFISHPANPQLRARLDPAVGDLRLDDLNRALLRLVYRILFWFVAEDRGALLIPDPQDADLATVLALRGARDRYVAYFSAARLRNLARRHRGTRHTDLWEGVRVVFDGLGTVGGIPELALPGIGGIFESMAEDGQPLPLDEPLAGARLPNEALLDAIRALSQVRSKTGGRLRRVDFGNLGAEELGSVYESLLERRPHYHPEELSYTLDVLPGNERKESGSYYTPTALVECLLDSALDPLLDEACKRPTSDERIAALLDITVCDPACGSGHFLVAAARRIAKRIAAEESGEPEPPEAVIRAALRRVTSRCIYGVDVNPMAAELARVALALEALEPGRPLAFLDQNIRVGNSLLGTTPALLAAGIPEAAFKPIEGDDKKVATALKKQNAAEQAGQGDLFSLSGIPVTNAVLAKRSEEIARELPDNLEDLHIHLQRQALELAASAELRQQKLLADAWCAAFVQPKIEEARPTAITQATLEAFASDSATLQSAAAEELVADLTRQYRFFHWHIEFPHIFRTGEQVADADPTTGWSGGFSCVIGNPPWETIELKEEEFFASRSPHIANAPNAAGRKRLIAELANSESPADRSLYEEFQIESRRAEGWRRLLADSGRFIKTAKGRINTYAVFAETGSAVIGSVGRSGLVLPTGIATDATTASFFSDIVRNGRLVSFLDFENEAFLLSRAVHHMVRFCLLTVCGRAVRTDRASFAFGTRYMAALPVRRFTMPPEEILLVNPNTGTTPVFRSRRDAEITIGIYKHVPVLWRDDPEENLWNLTFRQGLFNMASDSGLFRTRDQLEKQGWTLDGNIFSREVKQMLPLYEAKMIHYFDHRYGTYEGQTEAQANMGTLPRLTPQQQDDPNFVVEPRYWVQEFDTRDQVKSEPGRSVYSAVGVASRLAAKNWDRGWLVGWRRITNSANERTMLCTALPRVAAGDSVFLMLSMRSATEMYLVAASLSSFVVDYVLRQKMTGTNVLYFLVKQLPILPPSAYEEGVRWLADEPPKGWIRERVLELSYTAWDMEPFAQDLGDVGAPFRWDEDRRTIMRAELDAAYFHLYGLQRDDVEHAIESFGALHRREERQFGEFRTKRLILERYDAMTEAARTGQAYQAILDPPPGHGPRHPASR
jgi:hypothetical protein